MSGGSLIAWPILPLQWASSAKATPADDVIAGGARDSSLPKPPRQRTASSAIRGSHIVFHTLDHAIAALDTAAQLGAAVCLRTARGAVRYAGPAYLFDVVRLAISKTGSSYEIDASAIDCRDEPALAFAALRAGWRTVIYSGPRAYRDEVNAAVTSYKATLIARPPRALDLLGEKDPRLACLKWYVR